MIGKVWERTGYTLFRVPCHRESNRSQPINVKPKAVHEKRNAQTSSRACESKMILRPEVSLWELRAQARGRPPGRWTAFQTCYPRSAGSRRDGERAAESSFPASAWKAGPCSRVCSWQPGARGPAATSSRGGDVCAPGARAATEPRLCRRGARPARRPAPSRPPRGGRSAALGGPLAGPLSGL